ncbi:MAG: tight adherence protein [Frankiaceae bacterium]|nr:tight adherence protein [Frankiaceae bacterium]MDQ1643989.1 tight adherence protein [Cryptosporangiaceae bacterium]
MSPAATGALLGLVGGSALVYTLARTPIARRVTLADRIAPFLRDVPTNFEAARPITDRPGSTLLRPLAVDVVARLDRFLGGREALDRRLAQAGGRRSREQFRSRQLLAALLGALAGAALLALRLTFGIGPSPVTGAALVVVGAVGGVLLIDAELTRAIRSRETALIAEFPAVAELLALAVGAGESPRNALERVTRTSAGELAGELQRALADTRAGTPLVPALEQLAVRTRVAPISRFVDGLAIAVERGTPLADVLRAQASDVRESGKQALLEAGGRKEIAMMVPVVFCVLPVTVLFAAYPALASLTFTG